MGNQTSQTLTEDVNVLLVHFPPLSTMCTAITSTKLFKTAKCTEQQNVFFVKVFSTSGIAKEVYKNKLDSITSILNKIPRSHLLPSVYMEKENEYLGVLCRPYVQSSLRQKIIRPPFLNNEEKKWIGYQMLKSVQQLHSNYLIHGDIRPENYLLTSWNWILLSDIGFYKPITIPEGDMTSYNLFFAPGSREACYLAPERFISKGKEINDLQFSVDVFSLGCVIAELFLDGEYLFTLPQVLAYKKKEIETSGKLHLLPDKVKAIVINMILLDTTKRWTINQCIDYWQSTILPKFVHYNYYDFCSSLLERYTSDERVLALQDFVSNCETNEYSVIFCTILGSLIRNVSKPSYKILSVKLMTELAYTDDMKLHRVLPFFICLLNKQERSSVKSCCLHNIAYLLTKVKYISAKDDHLFKEYIWPSVSLCKNDESEWVRYTLADLMPTWGLVARKLLELGQHSCSTLINFDKKLGALGSMVGSIYNDLLKNREDSVHIILLSNFPHFVEHFSGEVARTMFRDVIFPWMSRGDKYQVAILEESEQYVKVLGGYFFKYALKPLEINLYGHSELLVYLSLRLVNYHVRMNIELLEKTLQYLLHPSYWIRTEMHKLIIEILRQLDPTKNFSLIRPMIIPYLVLHPSQVLIIDENTITTHLYTHVRRSVFNMMIIGKPAKLSDQEEKAIGNILSLIHMVGLPTLSSKQPSINPEPDDKIQQERDLDLPKQFLANPTKKLYTGKNQYFEGLGLTGELECVINNHESPVTHIIPTIENFVLSASKDGKIFLWKLNKLDDYSKIKYRELKKDIGMKPISLGCCGDNFYIGYKDSIKIWDLELTQNEQTVETESITEVTSVDNNTIVYTDINGNIFSKDFRDDNSKLIFKLGAQKGIVSKLTKISNESIGLGTISGHIILFDLRFCVPSMCYYNSYKQPVLSLASYYCKYKPLIEGAQLITALASEIVMWDLNVARPSVLFTKKFQTPLQVPYLIPDPFFYSNFGPSQDTKPLKDFEYRTYFQPKLERLEQYTRISSNFVASLTEFGPLVKKSWETRSNVLKILVPEDSNVILSTGEDAVVRIWDPISSKNSALLGQGGLSKPDYYTSIIPDVLVIQEQALPPNNIKKKRRDFDDFVTTKKISHSHTINDMAYLNQPKPLLFTGSNDGTIRIWR
jgi:serine/threonine protein kinase/WD40 repeat protein